MTIETDWSWHSTLLYIVVIFIGGIITGMWICWKKGLRLQRGRTLRRHVACQNQVTYRWDLATPRFQPLAEHRQGAWCERWNG